MNALTLPFFLISTGVALAQGPAPCMLPTEPEPAPAFEPWFYLENGKLVWDRHRYYEDKANTVFALARELVTVETPDPGPEVLLFNFAHFEPPEGVPAAPGTRRLLRDSIDVMGLQLYVNYSGALVDPSDSKRYVSPTFFTSIQGQWENDQTTPPVVDIGFQDDPAVSATRGAFGRVGGTVPVFSTVPLQHEPALPGLEINALYVTAGVGYAVTDFDAQDQSRVANASRDRLFVKGTGSKWVDQSALVPDIAREGNSSGAVFADFNGDGYHDLYVGLCGDNYEGAQNRLLIYDSGLGTFVDQTSSKLPAIIDATSDVTAADVNRDGKPDIIVANRARRNGAAGDESDDYILKNVWPQPFLAYYLAPDAHSDTRSVAVANLDNPAEQMDPRPEIVFGNAGSDGYSNDTSIPVADDDKMQIFRNTHVAFGMTFQNVTDAFINPGLERGFTGPLTEHVLIADLFGPSSSYQPDGFNDLVIVNHRDILLDAGSPGSNVYVLVNTAGAGPFGFGQDFYLQSAWGRTVALADFMRSPQIGELPRPDEGTLDVFVGTGNRFCGVGSEFHENMGVAGAAQALPSPFNTAGYLVDLFSYESMPGTEHGYGFDFADFTGDGFLDALQTARGYSYLSIDVASPTGPHSKRHPDFTTSSGSPEQTSNARGRLRPRGMEDGVFADFDEDGDLDALLASQMGPSGTNPDQTFLPDTLLLRAVTPGSFEHDTQEVPVFGGSGVIVVDEYIDLNGRTATPHPGTADRVVAGDFDNDGDVDAIVHLFQITTDSPTPVVDSSFPHPVDKYSFGWRYLQNIVGDVSGDWFRDVAPTHMLDQSVPPVFSGTWNRGLGMDVPADFDNNGALDLYATVGYTHRVGETIEVIQQAHDLLFLNRIGGQPVGVLTEVSASGIIPQPAHIDGDPEHWPGSFGLAQGDIDNDGDADVIVTRGSFNGYLAPSGYPSLYLNVGTNGQPLPPFEELFEERVPTANGDLDSIVHPLPHPTDSGKTMDQADFPAFLDFDADGDLDLVFQVTWNVPRLFRNKGVDVNEDGVINATDGSELGFFEDVTGEAIERVKPTTDSQDVQVADIDRDGDFDLVNDPFSDSVTFWRNDLAVSGMHPAVTEIWPRVGAIRGTEITIQGVRLDSVDRVQFRFKGRIKNLTAITHVSDREIRVVLPMDWPLGLGQVRLRRTFVPPWCTEPVTTWSTQYFGYFVLGGA